MRSVRREMGLLLLAVPCLVVTAWAQESQQKSLTLDDLYDPEKRIDFVGQRPAIRWLRDGRRYLEIRTDPGGHEARWSVVSVASGRAQPFYDPDKLENAIASIPGISRDDARRLARQRSYELSPSEDALLLTLVNDVFFYRLAEGALVRLTSTPANEEQPRFSPDGGRISFVRDNDLHVVDLTTRTERALTTDGGPRLLNGILNWVYQEEIYGRGDFKGYWWSPNGNYIAFLQLDETGVADFTLVDHIPYRLSLNVYPYPKAGDPNPRARLGIASAGGGPPRWVDLYPYQNGEFLIVRVSWTPGGEEVVYQVQNRTQTWLDLNLADPESGKSKTLFRETSPAWVNVLGEPTWLSDGGFLWRSERDGWAHLYHYRGDGTLVRQVTSGEWEVRELHGLDPDSGYVYFSGTERSTLGSDAYRIRLDGTGLRRLTETAGTHRVSFNAPSTHFVDTWSDVTTPPRVDLYRSDGTHVRSIERNPLTALQDYALSTPEFLTLEARDAHPLEAILIKPLDFDPKRRYPVFVWVYGGPHAQLVGNRWGGTTHLWYQLLAQKGVLVFTVDNRIASGKGARSTWNVYRNFGELELRDLEDAVAWLKQQPYVDGTRIGLGGWSFGGFMTTYALTHSETFRMGIAGGSVTDWRNYDTIYTERFMSTPQDNPEGYQKSSVVNAARNLQGRLLLIHGTMDDNVHLQNTLQLAYELQKAGKPFQLMLYPKSQHGVTDPHLVKHLQSLMTEFILQNLTPDTSPPATQ